MIEFRKQMNCVVLLCRKSCRSISFLGGPKTHVNEPFFFLFISIFVNIVLNSSRVVQTLN
jgi:hypothetical protein